MSHDGKEIAQTRDTRTELRRELDVTWRYQRQRLIAASARAEANLRYLRWTSDLHLDQPFVHQSKGKPGLCRLWLRDAAKSSEFYDLQSLKMGVRPGGIVRRDHSNEICLLHGVEFLQRQTPMIVRGRRTLG